MSDPRSKYWDVLAQLDPRRGEALGEYRQQVQRWCQQLADMGLGRLGLPPEEGGNPQELLELTRCLVHFDLSLFVKFGVHVGLVQGCLARLGGAEHRPWLEQTWNLKQLGCFAMTETDHGSHVRGLETRAVYRPETEQFEINTPHPGARKDYIGSALSAHFGIVFAQLEDHGVHAFLVPLRTPEGELLPGLEVEDCGPKMGLNGVDNGRISFHGVRIPRQHLLNRYAQVAPDGRYSSPIVSPSKRFFTMLSNLVDGRLSLSSASFEVSSAALGVALRYADRRRQFGQPEIRLLDYQMHQRRLLPRVALCRGLEGGVRRFVALHQAQDPELETFAAALKAYSTWSVNETLRLCRDCCGGWGYLSVNRFAAWKADTDVFTTFEGDNTVLTFLVARNLLQRLRGCRALLQWIPWPRRCRLDLDSLPVQQAALRFREQRLLLTLGQRLRHRMRQGLNAWAALGQCQQHAVALSQAYVERSLLDTFEGNDGWGSLLGLTFLEADRAWFLEHAYLSPRQSRKLRTLQLERCAQLKNEVLSVVAKWGQWPAGISALGVAGPDSPAENVP